VDPRLTSGPEAEAPRGSPARCSRSALRGRNQRCARGTPSRPFRDPSCAARQGAGANRGNGRLGHVRAWPRGCVDATVTPDRREHSSRARGECASAQALPSRRVKERGTSFCYALTAPSLNRVNLTRKGDFPLQRPMMRLWGKGSGLRSAALRLLRGGRVRRVRDVNQCRRPFAT